MKTTLAPLAAILLLSASPQEKAPVPGPGGLVVFLEDAGAARAIEHVRKTRAIALVQIAEEKAARAACEAADAAGFYGTRIFVAHAPASRIALADNLADTVHAPAGAPKAEVLRVLIPGGRGRIGGEEIAKPFPEGMDAWSHHYHGPDNNPQSKDAIARAPYLTQFVAEPRYAPCPQAAVAAGGRLFAAFGHVAWHKREELMMNTLLVLNAFNGTVLWSRPIKPGLMVDRSIMVATPENLYLADDSSCKVLDAATGESRGEITVPAETAGGTFWKWMALEGGVLYALVGPAEAPDAEARWRSTNHGWPWNGISKGYNQGEYAWGFSKTLFAIDPASRKVLWTHTEEKPIDARALCMKAGRIFVSRFGDYIAALDAKSGKELWRRTAEKDRETFEAIGAYRTGHGYIEGWKSTVYAKCTDKAVYFCGPQTTGVTAIAAEDGHFLFKRGVKNLHLNIRDDGLFVIGPERTTGETKKLDPLTGSELATYDISRRACTRATGSVDGIFFRAYDGTTRLDTATGKPQWIAPMRPSCQVGALPAHGLVTWIPWACDCNLQMFGVIALGPAGDFAFGTPAREEERRETAKDPAPAAFAVKPGDWPVYRADNARSARSEAAVPEKVRRLWEKDLAKGVEPGAPVSAGGAVFVGSADGTVRALDAATGAARWTAYTGGAVRFPPAISGGRALVGSGDGWAYAFEAATGRVLWRFRAAPAERRIPIHGALLSTWAVGSGVLEDRGTAYLAAGINSMDGTHVYALDAATGKIRWQNNTSGHLDTFSKTGVAVQGEMMLHDGKLVLAGGNASSPGIYDLKDGTCSSPVPQGVKAAGKRGRELVAGPNGVTAAGQPFYSHPDSPVYDNSVKWPPVVVAAKNARLTFTEKKGEGWFLTAQSADGGATLWEEALPSEPQRWGLAIDAEGRIVVTLREGKVISWGAK